MADMLLMSILYVCSCIAAFIMPVLYFTLYNCIRTSCWEVGT